MVEGGGICRIDDCGWGYMRASYEQQIIWPNSFLPIITILAFPQLSTQQLGEGDIGFVNLLFFLCYTIVHSLFTEPQGLMHLAYLLEGVCWPTDIDSRARVTQTRRRTEKDFDCSA